MLSWSKMRCWSRVLILLTVALAAFNAQCFAYCLTQGGGNDAAHCHQHGKAKCPQQHDLTTVSPQMPAPAVALIASMELPALAISKASRDRIKPLDESPPEFLSLTTLLPLRI
jgi:hypothetical protein